MLAITIIEPLAKLRLRAVLLLHFPGAISLAIALSLLVSAPAQAASAGHTFVYRLDAGKRQIEIASGLDLLGARKSASPSTQQPGKKKSRGRRGRKP